MSNVSPLTRACAFPEGENPWKIAFYVHPQDMLFAKCILGNIDLAERCLSDIINA